MSITTRRYDRDADYGRVSQFLIDTYRTAGGHINWLQPRWEYMHYHPLIRGIDLGVIGLWEDDGQIVAVVHPELFMGTAYLEVAPAHHHLMDDMLTYAEQHISTSGNGTARLSVYINDSDHQLQALAAGRGYGNTGENAYMSHFNISDPFPPISLPNGFRLQSLADDDAPQNVSRVLWRGFDHGDEPPHDDTEDRRFLQSAPNFRKDLNLVVVAPDGNFVSYCGMWYEPVHRLAYVEPVATDPDYRRMGLAKAAVLEGIRRCGEQGATIACVGAIRPLYLAIGFQQVYSSTLWQRQWT